VRIVLLEGLEFPVLNECCDFNVMCAATLLAQKCLVLCSRQFVRGVQLLVNCLAAQAGQLAHCVLGGRGAGDAHPLLPKVSDVRIVSHGVCAAALLAQGCLVPRS
jgi:hypothetical protein